MFLVSILSDSTFPNTFFYFRNFFETISSIFLWSAFNFSSLSKSFLLFIVYLIIFFSFSATTFFLFLTFLSFFFFLFLLYSGGHLVILIFWFLDYRLVTIALLVSPLFFLNHIYLFLLSQMTTYWFVIGWIDIQKSKV